MPPIELECPVVGCDLGEDGGRYKTPPLPSSEALQLLTFHHHNHAQAQGGAVGQQQQGTGGTMGGCKVEKVPRPALKKGQSEDKFLHFSRQWARYKRASNLVNDQQIRDQLLACCDEELMEELNNLHGDQLDTKTEEQLMAEMKTLAIVAQNHLVNIVRLRSLVQDRDEPIRSYLARLKGVAAVCKLTLQCSCDPQTTVSFAHREILHCLVKGLADEDIRRQVLGVVEQMDLDKTVQFIEAKESGKKAGVYLDSGDAGLNKVTGYRQVQRERLLSEGSHIPEKFENERCQYCGRKGHGAKPDLKLKKEICPAFDRKCNTCGIIGHFSRSKACRKAVKVEAVRMQHEIPGTKKVEVKTVGQKLNLGGQQVRLSVDRPIPHMLEEQGKMVVAMPKAHPQVRVQVEVNKDMYVMTGLPLKMCRTSMTRKGKVLQIPRVELLCDTGAQVDCLNRKKLQALGLVENQLLSPEVVVGCANESPAGVLGVFFGKVTAMEGLRKVQVQVLFYVLKEGGSILSRHTCEKFGIISSEFPKVGEHLPVGEDKRLGLKVNMVEKSEDVYQKEGECDPDSELPCRCPRREFVDPPDKMPYPPTEENRERLENWIKQYYASSAFLACKRQEMPRTEGPPMRIHTKPDAAPVVIHKPVPVPLHYRDRVNAMIEAEVKRGVLKKIGPGVPTTWCTKLVITAKKDGRPRMTVDLSGLTKAGIRETHHTRTPFKVVCSVPSGTYKTTLDCVDGYHGVPLAEEDQHKTTFLTEKGRFCYRRVPQGYGSSNDGYTMRTDEILANVPGNPEVNDYEKIVDDIIQWSGDMETAFYRVCGILSHCAKAGMVFSAPKFVFGAKEVEYAGFLVGTDSIQPTEKYIQNILDFPTPKNISDVRSWFGLVNQVAYAFSKGTIMAPFRNLLKPDNKFEWTADMNKSFEDSKVEIVRLVKDGVKMFDPKLVTCLSTDFCKTGLGWILQQKICKCSVISPVCCMDGWRLVLAGGRFTIPAEGNYSPVEGEALAVAVGLESSRYYTLGCQQLYVATDHKPLLSILNDRALDTIVNPRLLRLKERTLPWQFDMVYVPGGRQAAADALSRKKSLAVLAALSVCEVEQVEMEDLLQADIQGNLVDMSEAASQNSAVGEQGIHVMSVSTLSMITWDTVKDATKQDMVLSKLIEVIQRGIPDSSADMLKELREYHKFRHGLVVVDGVVTYKRRLVIPEQLRKQVLATIHAAHQGVSGMINRAEQSVFWPNITTDIERVRAMCRTCVRNSPSQPAGKPVAPPSPAYPFQMVATDYCHLNGVNYLVIVDRYSGWLSVLHVGKGEFNTDTLIDVFRNYFETFGVAEEISSDMASQYMSSKFQRFLDQYGIRHRQSSSYYAHSNSRAELGVKSGKRILMDNMNPDGTVNNDRFLRAMLQYRNTPQPDTRLSPAQVVYGRYMRDFIPVVNDKYEPKQEWAMVREYRERALARRLDRDGARLEQYTKKQRVIPIGGSVAVQNQAGRFPNKWDKTGVVVENKDHDKVIIRMDGSRRLTTRNRKFVKQILSPRDLPEMIDIPSSPAQENGSNSEVEKVADEVSTAQCHRNHIDDVGDLTDNHQSQSGTGAGGEIVGEGEEVDSSRVGATESDGQIQLSVPSDNTMQPTVGRPARERRPNVRYKAEEYDLSEVSAHKNNLLISGLHVRQKQGRQKNRGKY